MLNRMAIKITIIFITYFRKILNMASLNDFNVQFVRKQWSNMIAKYRQYKVSYNSKMIPNQ